KHVVTGHPQITRVHIRGDVAQRMADMQPSAAGIGEHVHEEELRLACDAPEALGQRASRVGRVERSLALPAVLPAQLDLVSELCIVAERGPGVGTDLIVMRHGEPHRLSVVLANRGRYLSSWPTRSSSPRPRR